MVEEYKFEQLSEQEMALVDELVTNRIPLPEIINIETLQAALDVSLSPGQLEMARG